MTHTHKPHDLDLSDMEDQGPPSGIMLVQQLNLEDAADVAFRRTRQLYDTILGTTEFHEATARQKRQTDLDKQMIWHLAEAADQLSFQITETIAWLSRAKAILDAYHAKYEEYSLVGTPQEASKSALGRAQ